MFTQTIKVNTLNATSKEQDDVLADEEPLEIRLGFIDSGAERSGARIHKSIALALRSPGQDRELGLGLLFSANIIQSAGQIMEIDDHSDQLIRIELSDDHPLDLTRLEQQFSANAALPSMPMSEPAPLQSAFQIRAQHLSALSKHLRLKQNLFHSTGSTHACANFNDLGVILDISEDISRHNAMDKMLGSLLLDNKLPLRKYGLLISGRASFSMLQKALMAECPMLVAIGAPSSLAVELARDYNISLVGLLDQEHFNIYHDDDRIIL